MSKVSRHLKISITEVVTGEPDAEEDELNPEYRGMLAVPTKLQVKYTRKTHEGVKYEDPLYPVYIDSLAEALSFILSLAAAQPEQIPIMSSLVGTRVSQRLKTYGLAKFPRFSESILEQASAAHRNPELVVAHKEAYMEYFNAQLNGVEKPCEFCKDKDCRFKGAFDKEE
jgi:hypothetical protein